MQVTIVSLYARCQFGLADLECASAVRTDWVPDAVDKQRFAERFLQSLLWNLGHNDFIHEGNSANSLANTDSDTTPDSNAISKIRAIAKMKAITLTQTSVGVDLCSAL
jgi:hypothetical protein